MMKQKISKLKRKTSLTRKTGMTLSAGGHNIWTKVMDSIAEGVFIIDAQRDDFPIIYSNPSFETMTGYTKNEIIGQNYFLLYGADANLHVVEEIKQAIHQGKYFHKEMLNVKKNGKKFLSSLRISPVRDTNGTITHYAGVQIDCTFCALMKQKDLEIKEQQDEILHLARVEEISEFVSSLAHEINQPLTAILSYAQAAQRLLAGREPQIQEILQYIINDDRRATEIIRHLRSLLKKDKSVFGLVDINVLINETVALMANDVIAKKVILKTELDANLPAICGDRIQLQQILLNLINNGLDAMDGCNDSRKLVIRTSRQNSEMLLVEVKDSGCGIPEENMKKLFHHFFTSKPNGLGMGLSISRSIVELHGGRLDVKNNPDRGATFYFTLPVDKKMSHEHSQADHLCC